MKPLYLYVKPKKGFANATTIYQWGDNKMTIVYEVSEELHEQLHHSSK